MLRLSLMTFWCCVYLIWGADFLAAAPQKLSSKEQKKLVEAYLQLDSKKPADWEKQMELLQQLQAVPALRKSEVRKWQKDILKQVRKGPKLPNQSGRHWYWSKEEIGLYILGGEMRKPKGLMIGMHGGGVGSGDAGNSHSAYNQAAAEMGWLAIFPEVLEKTERGWTDAGTEEWILDLIEDALRTWKIDPNHVYLAGHSMGGYGSWTLGAHHADRVAALAPAAGAPTPYMTRSGEVDGIVEGVIPNLRNVPMVIYQSADDPRVPPDANRAAVKELESAKKKWGGFPFEYWEVTGQGHGHPPGGTVTHLKKIASHKRDPYPEKIVWQPDLDWKHQFYWLWWDKPVEHAIVVAEIDQENNGIKIWCEKTTPGLQVLLNGEIVDMGKEVMISLNDQEIYKGLPSLQLTTLLKTAACGDEARIYLTSVPVQDD